MNEILKKYCCGCGLCAAVGEATLLIDKKGYYYPQSGDKNFLKNVCPCYGSQLKDMDYSQIWGKYLNIYYGWATNNDVRYRASSGGMLTALACFLLASDKVDYIIQTAADPNDQTKTITKISSSIEDIKSCCGSRYSISHPLEILKELDLTKRYAFIGKPCDITVLKNYARIYPYRCECIKYTLTFFCAGLPSVDAQNALLKELNVNAKNLRYLQYRGNGWPGSTIAIDSDGIGHKMDYEHSWGKVLGRDVMRACRFCLDGIGELADIACGDAWYLNSNYLPDFGEHEGRNIIFSRTQTGDVLLNEALDAGIVYLCHADVNELDYIQKYQIERRATMKARLIALRLCLRAAPKYKLKKLNYYSKKIPLGIKARYFLGTLKRVLNGRL